MRSGNYLVILNGRPLDTEMSMEIIDNGASFPCVQFLFQFDPDLDPD